MVTDTGAAPVNEQEHAVGGDSPNGRNRASRNGLGTIEQFMPQNDKLLKFMSWGEFHGLTSVLLDKLADAGVKPDVIIAITRGGLVPATVLAHHFHCRAFGILTIRRTTSDTPFSLPPSGIDLDLLALPEDSDSVQTVLLVDDIVGHGLTLRLAKNLLRERYPGKAIVAVALVDDLNLDKEPSEETRAPYIAAYEMTNEEWMVFPWESTPV